MRRSIKVFLLVVLTGLLLSFLPARASTEKIVAVDGASIRMKTENSSQGLRFYAKLDKSVSSNEHGFYLVYGKVSVKELEGLLATTSSNDLLLNGKEVFHLIIPGVTKDFFYSVVLTGIPEVGYEDDLTVIPYVKDGGVKIFPNKGVTRSVVDVARTTYNEQPEQYKNAYKEIIDNIVSFRKIKVISAKETKSYYQDFSNINLKEGDYLELLRGNYNDQLIVNVNDVSIIGANKDKLVDDFGKRINSHIGESIYNHDYIILSSGVSNFKVNGLEFNGLAGIEFTGIHNNIKIEYCSFKINDNWIIRDKDNSSKIDNLVISNNYFYSTAPYCRDIEFQGSVSSVLVSNNYFTNDLKDLDTTNYEYPIRFMQYEDEATIDIYQNTFNKFGSWYLIDVGYSHGTGSTRNVTNKLNLNIEDNKMTPHFQTCLEGNGIRAMYLSDNSKVSIIRNENFRTSPYYNAILLTTGDAANSTLNTSNLEIKIMHNKFYAEDLNKVIKPSSRNEVTSRFTRIGLGVPVDANLTLYNNYFANSTSRYAYTFFSSARATKNTNQIVLKTDEALDFTDANNGYNELLNKIQNKISLYLNEVGVLNENIFAYYGGTNNEDITKYIPSFSALDSNLFEIQNGELVFVGSDLYYRRIAQLQEVPIKEPTIEYILEDVVKTLAYSYYNKGTKFQYDLNSGRRFIIATPEMGTSETNAFFDCSGYINSIYYNAFGVYLTPETNSTSTNTNKIMDYARLNKNTSNEVIDYVLVSDVPTSQRSLLLQQVKNNLEVGDVIVYRYGANNSGHTIIYVGNETFLHSTGASYDYDNGRDKYERNGTVELLPASEVFENTTSRRYLFNDKYNFCVLRPLNREGLTLTDSAKSRMKLQGIDIEKHASAPNFTDITVGEEITYNITLKNLGTCPFKNFTVNHNVSDYVTVIPNSISHNGIYEDGKITYLIPSLKVNEQIELKYTVKINNNSNNIGSLLESKSYIESIPTNTLYHTIVQVNETDKNKLAKIISSFDGSSQTSSYRFFNDIYNEFANQTNVNNPLTPYSKLTDIFNSNLAVPYLYGGKLDDKTQSNNLKFYARNLKISYFEVGDILMCYNGSIYKNYLYDGVNFLTYSSGKIDLVSGTTAINQVLDSVNSYEKFKVIRPSLNIQ